MLAVKRALKLNNRQATLMAEHAGFRQVVFNRGLSRRTQRYSHLKVSDSKGIDELKKVLINYVNKQPDFAWIDPLSSRVNPNALIDLKNAFNRYRSRNSAHPTLASRRGGQLFTVNI